MKPADLFPLLGAVNSGWTFAAFVVIVGVYLYVGRRDTP
jgi:hypothetical protein